MTITAVEKQFLDSNCAFKSEQFMCTGVSNNY